MTKKVVKASKIQSFVQSLISSLGVKRKLTNLFKLLSTLISTVPSLAPFSAVLSSIASYLGIVAVGQSLVARTFKLDIHTVAAFFVALNLAVSSVPELMPYAYIIAAISTVLSTLATGVASVEYFKK